MVDDRHWLWAVAHVKEACAFLVCASSADESPLKIPRYMYLLSTVSGNEMEETGLEEFT